jgi:predicted lactoylglutathione lyase
MDTGMTSDPGPLANVMVTLGARDLRGLRDFYRRVGWEQVIDDDDFAAFDVHGVVLALFPVDQLARDGRGEPEPGNGGIRFTVGIMVDSAEEVNELTERLRTAGATVTKDPVDAEFFIGRSAYLCDPEGNYFEVAWAGSDNPITSRRIGG